MSKTLARPIATQWSEFEDLVLPKDCSVTQRVEMRRAFYAGAVSMFQAVAYGLPELPNAVAEARLTAYANEVDAWCAELLEAAKQ